MNKEGRNPIRLLTVPRSIVVELLDQVDAQEAEINRLREALGFYGDENNWLVSNGGTGDFNDAMKCQHDAGCRARAALEAAESIEAVRVSLTPFERDRARAIEKAKQAGIDPRWVEGGK